jgi:hypothetical protein
MPVVASRRKSSQVVASRRKSSQVVASRRKSSQVGHFQCLPILPGPDIGEFMEFAIKVDSTFGRLRLDKIDFLEYLIRDEINWVGQIIENSFILDWTVLVIVIYCILCIATILMSVSVLTKRRSLQGAF